MTANALLTALLNADREASNAIVRDYPDPYGLAIWLGSAVLGEMRRCAGDEDIEARLQQQGIERAALIAENERRRKAS